MKIRIAALAVMLCVVISLFAACSVNVKFVNDLTEVSLNGYFSSNMVLQRDRKVSVFGKGADGAEVTVEFAGQTKTTTVANSKWLLYLDEMEVCAEGRDLVVSSAGKSKTLTNVLVGDVWLCSGQSNMEWHTYDFSEDTQTKVQANARNNLIRSLFVIPRTSDGVQDDIEGVKWVVSDTQTVLAMSAYAICFAQALQPQIGVPMGILTVAVGSTMISQWLKGGNYYNSEIAPLIPFTFMGVLWYQGESDLLKDGNFDENYRRSFTELCRIYREDFGNTDCPVIVTQIANYNLGGSPEDSPWSWFRQTQFNLTLDNENVYLVCGVDLNPYPIRDLLIHPDVKIKQGARAALVALECVYKADGVYGTAAYLEKAEMTDDGLLLTFANVKDKLVGVNSRKARMLSICGEDNEYKIVVGEFVGTNQVLVDVSSVTNFKTIRYCWEELPTVSMKSQGIPVLPFHYTLPQD